MLIRVGANMNSATATIAIATPAAILPALLFLARGDTAVKSFRTPHMGQADRKDPYLLPHTGQSIQEATVYHLPPRLHPIQNTIPFALFISIHTAIQIGSAFTL